MNRLEHRLVLGLMPTAKYDMIEDRRTAMMMRSLGVGLLLLSLVLPCQAQGTIIVDAAGSGDFTEIQPAVDAAPVGSLIRIRHGAYQGVTIRKGLRLIGDKPDLVNDTGVLIEGSVRVLDLPANQSFVGTDLFMPDRGAGPHTFTFENCRGNIHLAKSVGRLVVRRCNYVTTDVVGSQTAGLGESGALVEDSFLIATNSWWNSSFGVVPMEAFRSKVILVACILRNVNSLGLLNPANSALELTDSELIYTPDVDFIVWCDPSIQVCPPDIASMGSSTTELNNKGGAVLVEISDPDLLQLKYFKVDSIMDAVVAGFPTRPFNLPEGTLYTDLVTSILLHLGKPLPPFGNARIPLSLPTGNRFGIPITFQGVSLLLSGEIILGTPLTVVF